VKLITASRKLSNVLIVFFSQLECCCTVDVAVLCSSDLWQSKTEQYPRKGVT